MKINKGTIFEIYYEEITTEFLDELAKNIMTGLEIQPYEDHLKDGTSGNFDLRTSIVSQILSLEWWTFDNGKLGMIFYLSKAPALTSEDLYLTAYFKMEKIIIMLKDRSKIPVAPFDFDNEKE